MNLPTVTIDKNGKFGPAGYIPDLSVGTYALVRVAEGETATGEKAWVRSVKCEKGKDGFDLIEMRVPHGTVGTEWVLLVRGAAHE